jgi:hypothetical protein
MVGLVAYTGVGPVPHLLQCVAQSSLADAVRPPTAARIVPSFMRGRAALRGRAAEACRHYESKLSEWKSLGLGA